MFEKCYAICLSFRDTWIRPVFSGVRVQFVQLHFITIVLSAWKRCWFVCTINCFEGCFYLGYFSLFISNTTSATSVAGTVYSRKISVHPRFIFHWGLRCSIFSILCTELWISVWFSSLCYSIRCLSIYGFWLPLWYHQAFLWTLNLWTDVKWLRNITLFPRERKKRHSSPYWNACPFKGQKSDHIPFFRNCLPFRSTWVHPRLLVVFVLLDL